MADLSPCQPQVGSLRKAFRLAVASLEEERRRLQTADAAAGVHVQRGTASSLLRVAYSRCEAAQLEIVTAAMAFEEATG